MNEQGKPFDAMVSSLAPVGKEAEETLHSIVLGDADAIIVETKNGPRVYTLRDAAEPYRELVQRMPGAAIVLDADQTIIYCNGGLPRMLGRDGLAGASLLDVVARDHAQRAKGLISAAASGQFNTEMELLTADGARTRVRASAASMSFDGQSCVAMVVTALDDIDALRESEQRLRLFIEHAPAGIVMLDRDLRYLAVSQRWRQIYDVDEDIIGRGHYEVFPQIPEAWRARHQRCLAGAVERVEVPFPRTDGRVQWLKCEMRPWHDGHGGIGGILISSEDVTDAHNAEQTLRTSEAYSRSLFESSPDCVKVLGLDGRLEQMNGNGRCTMQIDDFETVRGNFWSDLWPREARAGIEAAMAEARAGRTGQFSGFRPTEKGVPKWWDVVITAVPGADGFPERLIASSRDVTERKRAEKELRESEQRLKLLVEASSNVVYRMSPDWGEMRQLTGNGFLAKTTTTSREWLMQYIPSFEHERVAKAIDEAIRTRGKFELEHRVIKANGDIGWTYSRALPLLDCAGEIIEWIGSADDVTARKQDELALRTSEAALRLSQTRFATPQTRRV